MQRDKYKKGFANQINLANYLLEKSIPAYKEKHLPLINKAHYIFDTYENKFYKNQNL